MRKKKLLWKWLPRLILFAALVLGVILSGCGGGTVPPPQPTPVPTTPGPAPLLTPMPTTTSAPTPIPTPVPTPTPTPTPTHAPTSVPTLVPTPTPPPSDEVIVPINLKSARNVGSLYLELDYDSDILKATGVKADKLARNAMVESNLKTEGRVKVGILDAAGINGDGALITISFNVVSKEGTSELVLENLRGHNADTMRQIITTASAGQFTAKDRSVTPPVVLCRGE